MTFERFEELAGKNIGKRDGFFADELKTFGYSKQTILNAKASGRIRAEGKLGNKPFFSGKEVHRFLTAK